MAVKKATREHDEAVKEALGQLHGLVAGKKVDVARSQHELEVSDIAMLRRSLGLSQQAFAEKLRVSVDTIQNWEQGRRQPRGPARALLALISRYPHVIVGEKRAASELGWTSAEEAPRDNRSSARVRASVPARHPLDLHVGQRIRQRRWLCGLTQQQLAERIGTEFSIIQEYETGKERVNSRRLWDIAAVLNAPVSFFFEGLEGPDSDISGARGDILTDKEALELVRAYYTMSETQRRRLFDLARVLSDVA